jgi:hypothetical protein
MGLAQQRVGALIAPSRSVYGGACSVTVAGSHSCSGSRNTCVQQPVCQRNKALGSLIGAGSSPRTTAAR